MEWRADRAALAAWARGRTGFPFVDAVMRELAATGYTSNRGRQNVASFLAKDLRLDWRLGAQLFEALLTDHDPAVNTCNWNYFSGVGNDPRNRRFKTVSQGMTYDSEAWLIGAWLPELARLPLQFRHMPWALPAEQAAALAFRPGVDYPQPLSGVEPSSQVGFVPGTSRDNRQSKGSFQRHS